MKNKLVVVFVLVLLPSLGLGQKKLVTEWVATPHLKVSMETVQQSTQPVVVGDLLFSADLSGTVTAFHRLHGYPLWTAKVPGPVDGSLAYGRSKLFVGDLRGNLTALNARDGSVSWKFKITSEWLSPALVHRDRIVIQSANDEVYALSETKGTELWHYSHRGDEKMTVRGNASPAVWGDKVFLGFSDGYLAAVDINNGVELWTKRLRSRDRFYDVDATPVVDADGVIAASFDGKAYSLDVNSGAIQWVFPSGAYSSPVIAEERVFLAGLDGHVYALERKTSKLIWKSEQFKGVGLGPAMSDNFLVMSSSEGLLLVLDPKTGKTLLKESHGAGTLAPPASAEDNWFYILSNYNNLSAYRVADFLEKKGPETVASPKAVVRDLEFSANPKKSS